MAGRKGSETTDRGERDRLMLRRALSLASLGIGTASPNPLVGAVVARDGRVLAQGFHRKPGEPHAEALALRLAKRAGRDCRGATLYTNLEPCCHTGRTPPCVDAILGAGVTRVVAAIRDPNPKVDGKGFRALRRHGVEVEVGCLRAEAMTLNAGFLKLNRTGMPFVTLKAAVSLDGRIATSAGESKWITAAPARRHARLLRRENDAILVGIGTALADDPRLDRRPEPPDDVRGPGLLKIVLDPDLRLPPSSRLLRTAGPVVVMCGPEPWDRAARARARRLEKEAAFIEELPRRRKGRRLHLRAALRRLGERGVTRLLVEGGGETHAGFLEEGLADRFVLYVAPRLLGGRSARPVIGGEGVSRVAEAPALRAPRIMAVGGGWVIEGLLAARAAT